MDILFKDKKMQEACNNISEATRIFGKNAKKVMRRINELRQASTLEVMRKLPGRCHELHNDKFGQLSIDVNLPHCLYFEPVGTDLLKADSGLDWKKVTTIRILRYGTDTHE